MEWNGMEWNGMDWKEIATPTKMCANILMVLKFTQ